MRAGIQCHREADATFHDLPVFLTQSAALTRTLLDTGLNRGAARAIGHAGWELLFDGALLDDAGLVEAYLTAMRLEVHDADWNAALARRSARGVPTIYAEPDGVAEIMRRVLSSRRLLAFDASFVPTVATALADAQPAIAAAVDEVFAAVTPAASR